LIVDGKLEGVGMGRAEGGAGILPEGGGFFGGDGGWGLTTNGHEFSRIFTNGEGRRMGNGG
jgi:hypothetical protein